MIEWFNKLPDAAKGAIIGAFIGSIIAALIGLLTIFLKDFLIPIFSERRTDKKSKNRTFNNYAQPIAISSISLLYRIKEIFYRGHFLLDGAPKNNFNTYKYISSVYRLCVLMAWIRAAKIELSNISVNSSKDYLAISNALNQFEKSLADGEHIEQSVLEQLSKLWNINLSKLTTLDKKLLGIEIEKLIDEICYLENTEYPFLLTDENKLKLASTVSERICEKVKCGKISDNNLKDTISFSIKEMTRVEALIYRDWQSAIGDLMLKKSIKESERKFDVIGFKEFEEIWYDENPTSKKWITRIDK